MLASWIRDAILDLQIDVTKCKGFVVGFGFFFGQRLHYFYGFLNPHDFILEIVILCNGYLLSKEKLF